MQWNIILKQRQKTAALCTNVYKNKFILVIMQFNLHDIWKSKTTKTKIIFVDEKERKE